ncbi:MAG: class I SAM-dependent methyltransferase [Candidatus Roizmanbacteria bacterium]|nr:class I SAM-dependent methyltransferase [Candidatus Roizmanbacteria bacterium]
MSIDNGERTSERLALLGFPYACTPYPTNGILSDARATGECAHDTLTLQFQQEDDCQFMNDLLQAAGTWPPDARREIVQTPPYLLRLGNKIVVPLGSFVPLAQHRLRQQVPDMFPHDSIFYTYAPEFHDTSHFSYSASTAHAITQHADRVEDQSIIDFGSSTGVQSLVALNNGAASCTMIDDSSMVLPFIADNMELNHVKKPYTVIVSDFTHPSFIPSLTHPEAYDVAIANIGPHAAYGGPRGAQLGVIRCLAQMPRVHTAFLGGYDTLRHKIGSIDYRMSNIGFKKQAVVAVEGQDDVATQCYVFTRDVS